MSMKRILGMMLASRMAGRGMRGGRSGGFGGGLGGLAGAGMLGGRKAGLAALGYMAYRAYQDHQARADSQASKSAAGSWASAGASNSPGGNVTAQGGGLTGALGGIVKSVTDALSGPQGVETKSRWPDHQPDQEFAAEVERAAASLNENTALLLVRAMVTAASADGSISAEERSRILDQAVEAGADVGDQRTLEHELANPRPLDELLGQVCDQKTAEEFYLASRMAIDDATDAHRAYLSELRERLGLAEQDAAEIDTVTYGRNSGRGTGSRMTMESSNAGRRIGDP